jgi:hypothetical protein
MNTSIFSKIVKNLCDYLFKNDKGHVGLFNLIKFKSYRWRSFVDHLWGICGFNNWSTIVEYKFNIICDLVGV